MLFESYFNANPLENHARIERLENYHVKRFSPLIFCLLFTLIGFGYWAYTFTISEVSSASGEVIASSRVQLIQAVDGGVLATLNVKEGDRVKQGQTLARLDDTRFIASAKEIAVRLSALRAKAARLRAEVTQAEHLEFPPSVAQYPNLVEVETALFLQRRNGLNKELKNLKNAVKLSHEEVDMIKALARSGDSNKSQILRTQQALNDSEAALIVRENRFFEDASNDLTSVDNEIAQNEQVLAQRNRELKDSVFIAPVSGIVKNIRITTLGGVLRSGEELMQIIPVDDELLIEAKVSPADIARVQVGLPATLRFDPFDYTIYGAVIGKVVYVSPDTIKENTEQRESAYYRAHIATSNTQAITTTGRKLNILPGMTAQVDIKTGTRTVMDFLLKPLRKTLFESFGER